MRDWRRSPRGGRWVAMSLAVALLAPSLFAADETNSAHRFLLLDSLGRLVSVATNLVDNKALLPSTNLDRQIPNPARGASIPPEILERIKAGEAGLKGIQILPANQTPLMPYLFSQDEYGNTAARHGSLFYYMPLDPLIQGGKYWLSDQGLRYSLDQTFTAVSMTDVMKGDNDLAYYTFDLKAKWAVFNAPADGVSGWVSAQVEAKTGLDAAGRTQDARKNLGSITDPTGIWSSDNGVRVPELAWQESLSDGELVLVAGMINQENYLDGNAYAGSGRGQFINSALIHTMVVPLASYNFGLNLQWQPTEHWYGMLGGSAGEGHAGSPPWNDFTWNNWSVVGEIGYVDPDFLGLGPGIYRIQPFVGQPGVSSTKGGGGLDLQQQLGHDSPFGWFGRFGLGGQEKFHNGDEQLNTGTQVGTGLVMHAPLDHLGLVPQLKNDLFGAGFVWSHPREAVEPVYHSNEYVLETFYTLQLTPLMRLQPDFQVVWNPAHNPDPGPALVGQLQLVLAW